MVYSILVAVASARFGIIAIPFLHLAVFLITAALVIRVVGRSLNTSAPGARAFGIAVAVAGLSSLPFYIAYFMPDILAGVLVLCITLVAVFGRDMTIPEHILAIMLGILAVLNSHPSHLVMAAVLLPVAALAGWLIAGRRWWVPALLVGLIFGAGIAERIAFSYAAEESLDAEVVYYPFLTARLIQDGVGYEYLHEICPDDAVETCALHNALAQSTDPERLTASHILFERSESLGSFRRLPDIEQQLVANEQIDFAISVFLSKPLETIGAIINNTWTQARMNSIRMTLPYPVYYRGIEALPVLSDNASEPGRLAGGQSWIPSANVFHNGVYAVSVVVLVVLMLWPGRLSAQARVFALFIIAGIIANAFVCGAISQPADRYGARIVWLLPFAAALLAVLSFRPKQRRPDA